MHYRVHRILLYNAATTQCGRRWDVWQQPEPHGDSIQSNREDSIGWQLLRHWLKKASLPGGRESLDKIKIVFVKLTLKSDVSIIEQLKTRFCRSIPLQGLQPFNPSPFEWGVCCFWQSATSAFWLAELLANLLSDWSSNWSNLRPGVQKKLHMVLAARWAG